MESGDLKTAFLSGDPDPAYQGSDALYIDPPSDLKRWSNLGPEDVLRLRKAVYGLINAPLRWQPSPSTSWFCATANGPVYLDSSCGQSCERCCPCRCANQIESSCCRFPCVTCSGNSEGLLETTEKCFRCAGSPC